MKPLRRLQSGVLLLWMNGIFSYKITLTFNYYSWYFTSSEKFRFQSLAYACVITAYSANAMQAACGSLRSKQQVYLQNILSIRNLIKLTW